MLPWCASAIDRTMCNPSPVPWMALGGKGGAEEPLEEPALLLERDTHAVVADDQLREVAHGVQEHLDAPALRGELHRVAYQV
jgi:hypothetical protein